MVVENSKEFWFNLFVKCMIAAAVVKYGELYLGFPFELPPSTMIAASLITIPTIINVLKWNERKESYSVAPESLFPKNIT